MQRNYLTAAVVVAGLFAAAAAVAQQPFTEASYPERGFAASFPGTPKLVSSAIAGKNPLGYYEYSVIADKNTYEIVVMQFSRGRGPSDPGTAYFDPLVDNFADGTHSKVQSRASVVLAGKTGAEATYAAPERDRYWLVDLIADNNDRVFLIASIGPKGHEASADAKRFRDSFKLLP